MKIQEVYVGELMLMIAALDFQQAKVAKTYWRRMRGFRIAIFCQPWRRSTLLQEMLAESKAVLEMFNAAQELRDKLLDSQGFDDDMQPATLKDIIAKRANPN